MGSAVVLDPRRREVLRRYNILDTPPEKEFDDITQLASKICETPIAVVSLIDDCRQWFKSRVGIEAEETSLDSAICTQTIMQSEMLLVPDTLRDPRFAEHPAVINEPHIRFYAGVPLINAEGFALGTLCVSDFKPRNLNDLQVETLQTLARQVLGQLELRRNVAELKRSVAMRQEVTNALRESEERFRGAFDEAPIGMALTNTDGEFMLINSALCEILGYSDPELRRLHLRDLVHPDDLARELELREEALDKKLDSFHVEQRYIHRAGHIVWGLLAVSLVWDAHGTLKYYIIQIQNISDRRRMEAEIAASRDDALHMAQEKARFLANMSHEIRTPLNGIIGMTSLLRDTDLSPQQREFTGVVLSSADALLSLINDILDFSKIEAGKLNLEKVPFDLFTVVEAAAELLAEPAQRNGIELVLRIDPRIPSILLGDPGRIRQILTNLLSNAVKFTERGEVVLHITPMLDIEQEEGTHIPLRFAVKDSGIGISSEGQKLLFQAFSQAEDSTTRKYGGTGLGLTICRQLVELMGGEIGVESALGQGSTFWFHLPLEYRPAVVGEMAAITDGEQSLDGKPLVLPRLSDDWQGGRILVVDDNATALAALRDQLTAMEIRVETASNSAAALAAIYRAITCDDPFRLVMLDGQMPGMDGMMLARAIRAEPTLTATPLVLMLNVGHWDAEEIGRLGIVTCLTKPLKKSALIDALNSIMPFEAALEAASRDTTSADTAETLSHPAVPVASTPARGEVRQEEGEEEREAPKISDGVVRPRILIAEDNAVNQKVAILQLENLGYTADAVKNGEEALTALETGNYDIVLMDCQMPKMDGYRTAAEFRRREAAGSNGRRVTIIALTANVIEGVREKCLAAGMDDYLRKPVQMEEMAATLQRWSNSGNHAVPPQLRKGVSELTLMPVLDVETWRTLHRLIVSTRSVQSNPEGNDRARLEEIAGKFFDSATRRIRALQLALQNGENQTVLRLSHTLRGSCASFGAHRMAKYCSLLEEYIKAEAYDKTSAIPAQLEAELEQVRRALPETIDRMVQK